MGSPLGITRIELGTPPDFTTGPTYTDIFNETLGAAATDADGFPEAVDKVNGLLDAFGSDVADTAAGIDIPGLIAQGSGLDIAPLDTTITNYEGTVPMGRQLVAATQALAPPDLLTFPIDPAFGPGLHAPPAQATVDLGTHRVVDGPFSYELGTWELINERVYRRLGIQFAVLSHGDSLIFRVNQVTTSFQRDPNGTTSDGYYALVITPATPGALIAQVSVAGGAYGTGTIVTFNLTLIP